MKCPKCKKKMRKVDMRFVTTALKFYYTCDHCGHNKDGGKMGKNKYGTCPYCGLTGELVWYAEEYVCEECRFHFSEENQMKEYWQSEANISLNSEDMGDL